MKTKFNNFIKEKFNGKNQTIGFRYSEPDEQFEITFNMISDLSKNDFEDDINNILTQNLDNYNLTVEEEEFENIHKMLDVDKDKIKMIMDFIGDSESEEVFIYDVIIDVFVYDEDEINAIISEIDHREKSFILPNLLINGKENSKYKRREIKGY